MYFRSKNNRKENLAKIKKELASFKYTKLIVDFIENSERGINLIKNENHKYWFF